MSASHNTSPVNTGMTNSTEVLSTAQGSILHINTSNITKLNASSYLMWSRQVQALLDGYGLAAFLDESTQYPEAVITVDGSEVPNPRYVLHKRQDRLVYSAILGAITQSIQPTLSKATTSVEIWTTLAATNAKPSRAHIKQLHQQLKNWKKGTKSITEYLQGITTRVDQMALLGKVLDLEDQVEQALDGLPEEYKQIVDQIESRDAPPTMTELHERLRNNESKLVTAQGQQVLPVFANVATNRLGVVRSTEFKVTAQDAALNCLCTLAQRQLQDTDNHGLTLRMRLKTPDSGCLTQVPRTT